MEARPGLANSSEQINELAGALIKAQQQIRDAQADSDNPFFKSKYASLSAVYAACKDALNKAGLAIIQRPLDCEVGIKVETILLHASGQWLSGIVRLNVKTADAQAYGSAISYAKRYSLASMVGVTTRDEDDDGNSAAASVKNDKPKQTPKPAPKEQHGETVARIKQFRPEIRDALHELISSKKASLKEVYAMVEKLKFDEAQVESWINSHYELEEELTRELNGGES